MIKIFIDIDNIVADFASSFLKFLNLKTGKKLSLNDIRQIDFHKCFDITKEEERKFHNEFLKRNKYSKLKCVKGCREGIEKLK